MGGGDPLAAITKFKCWHFLWKQVTCHFGLLKNLVTNNANQFEIGIFKDFYGIYAIRHIKAFVAYPQVNRKVENTMRTIMDGLKKKMDESGPSWMDDLLVP